MNFIPPLKMAWATIDSDCRLGPKFTLQLAY